MGYFGGYFSVRLSDSIRAMEILLLSLLGLCFGSFVNALVWRIKKKRDIVHERSECTHCHHILAWFDLVPVLSWLMLRGRCRYCHKRIDDTPLVELVVAVLFVVSYVAWPYAMNESVSWWLLGMWLMALVALVALADYDIRWKLLPDAIVFPLIGLGAVIGYLRFGVLEGLGAGEALLEMVGGVSVIAGLYFVLYYVSKGKWVGFGDVKLSIFIGLVLGWQGAIVALFAANLLGTIWVLPGLLSRRLSRTAQIPFGPFLIAACIVTFLWGAQLIKWYLQSVISL